jgi:hypothetical protein
MAINLSKSSVASAWRLSGFLDAACALPLPVPLLLLLPDLS